MVAFAPMGITHTSHARFAPSVRGGAIPAHRLPGPQRRRCMGVPTGHDRNKERDDLIPDQPVDKCIHFEELLGPCAGYHRRPRIAGYSSLNFAPALRELERTLTTEALSAIVIAQVVTLVTGSHFWLKPLA